MGKGVGVGVTYPLSSSSWICGPPGPCGELPRLDEPPDELPPGEDGLEGVGVDLAGETLEVGRDTVLVTGLDAGLLTDRVTLAGVGAGLGGAGDGPGLGEGWGEGRGEGLDLLPPEKADLTALIKELRNPILIYLHICYIIGLCL